ncbi:carboxymuconolactone decarboxylase family protein [Chloroflexota bacterium]
MEYLPEVFKEFQKKYPDITKAHDTLGDSCYQWGPLDKKALRLIKVGIGIGFNSEGAVRSHARRALHEGITPDELRHATLMGLTTVGFPQMIAAMKWIEEVIEKGQ